jgi:RNA polymerase sigma-70 factor (ECF subfamily)
MNGSTQSTPAQNTPPPEVSVDLSLVERARAGDREAFEDLYHRHIGRVYALCLRMAGNASEAEELAQEALVRAWRKLGSFKGSAAFGSWLHRLTVNVVLGSWRRSGRRRQRIVPMAEGLEGVDPGHEIRPRERVDLERAIRELPKGARTIFVLHDIEGLTHPDIAERTGLAVGTCKAQLHRARRLLRERLSS